MNNKLSLVLLAALLSLALIGCNKQKQDQTATTETEAPTYMEVDALLASADSLVVRRLLCRASALIFANMVPRKLSLWAVTTPR